MDAQTAPTSSSSRAPPSERATDGTPQEAEGSVPNAAEWEMRQKPQCQVEHRGNLYRCNHRHPSEEALPEFGPGRGGLRSTLRDVHVLGPLRAERVMAKDDLARFVKAYSSPGRAAALYVAQLETRRSDPSAELGIQSPRVDVETDVLQATRRARAVFELGGVTQRGPWKRSRMECEQDLDVVAEAFRFGGSDGARAALEGIWDWVKSAFARIISD